MEAMVYKNGQKYINLSNINIEKCGTKKKVVQNTSKRPKIIGREARNFFCCSIGYPFYWVHESVGADYPQQWIVCVMIPYIHSGIFNGDSKYCLQTE